MLETVGGEEALEIFANHYGIARARPGGEAPDGELLRAFARCFSRLPYENISKIIKSAGAGTMEGSLRLPAEVAEDHVEKGFGGTCFSLTFLLERMLRGLGFDCHKVMAHMHMGENVHCLVVVRQGGVSFMIDPGYALYSVIPLPARGRTAARCPQALVDVSLDESGMYNLHTLDSTGMKWRYRFRDVPVPDHEFERFWIDSFGKPTLKNICLGRITEEGHLYFRKDFLKFASPTDVKKRRLKHGIEGLISQEFGIDPRWVRMARDVLEHRRR